MNLLEIKETAKRGVYLNPKEYQRQINWLVTEVESKEKALAETEDLWRQERDKNRELIANEWRDCQNCGKWMCLVPCPSGQRQHERMAAAMASE